MTWIWIPLAVYTAYRYWNGWPRLLLAVALAFVAVSTLHLISPT